MKKALSLLFVLSALLLSGCAKYQETDFVGKTSAQIEAEYGKFACVGVLPSADGLYRNTACGYTVKEARKGFLGTDPEVLFFIHFDENGTARSCTEGYRPGG